MDSPTPRIAELRFAISARFLTGGLSYATITVETAEAGPMQIDEGLSVSAVWGLGTG